VRTLLYLSLILLFAVVGAAFVLPRFLDWNGYRPALAAYLTEQIGQPVRIDGDLSVKLLPWPEVAVERIRVLATDGRTLGVEGTIGTLQAELGLRMLLGGSVQVRKTEVAGLTLAVTPTRPDDGEGAGEGAGMHRPEGAWLQSIASGVSASMLNWFRGTEVLIRGGVVVVGLISARGRRDLAVTVDEARLGRTQTDGPFEVNGRLRVGGLLMEVAATENRPTDWEGAGTTYLDLGLTLPTHQTTIRLPLRLASQESGDSVLSGRLIIEGQNLEAFLTAVRQLIPHPWLPPSVPVPSRDHAFHIDGDWQLTRAGGRLEEVTLQVGGSQGRGRVAIQWNGTGAAAVTTVTGRLLLDRVVLDDWSNLQDAAAAAQEAEGWGGSGTEAATGRRPETASIVPAVAASDPWIGLTQAATWLRNTTAALRLPRQWRGDLSVRVDKVLDGSAVFRAIDLAGRLEADRLHLDRLRGLGPGGTEVAVSGVVSSLEAGPGEAGLGVEIDLGVEATADDLPALLASLPLPQIALPATMEKRFRLGALLTASPDRIEIGGLDGELAGSRFDGGAAIEFEPRPSVSLMLELDDLDLEGVPGAGSDLLSALLRGLPRVAPEAVDRPDWLPPPLRSGLAMLDRFDADLSISVERSHIAGLDLKRLTLDADLRDNVLTVTRAAVEGPGGMIVSLQGDVQDAMRLAELSLKIRAAARTLTPLARALAISESVVLDRLGEVAVRGRIGRESGPLAVHGRFDVSDGRIVAGGLIRRDEQTGDPTVDLRVRVYHPRFGWVIALFDPTLAFADGEPGALDIYGEVSGTDPAYAIDALTGTVGGVSVTGAMSLDRGGSGRRAAHGDGGHFGAASRFWVTFDGAFGRVEPARWRLTQRAPAAAGVGAAEDAGPWPVARLPLAWLRRFDGRMSVSIDDLRWQRLRFRRVALEAALAQGRVTLSGATARLADGQVGASGWFDVFAGDREPAWQMRLTAEDVLLDGPVLDPDAADDVLDFRRGAVDATADLRGHGTHPQAWLESLAGTAGITVERGMLQGLALDAAAAAVSTTGAPELALERLRAALQSGTTIFRQFQAAFTLHDGIATADRLILEADSGRLTGQGQVRLPARTLALYGDLVLAAPGQRPSIGLSVAGPFAALERNWSLDRMAEYLRRAAAGGTRGSD